MILKPLAISITAALVFAGFGCKQEQPKAPPAPPMPTTSAPSTPPPPTTSAPAPTPGTTGQSIGSKIGENVDDAALTAKVKAALLRAPDVKGTDVNVETEKGVVQLSGFVRTNAEIDRAVEIAKRVEGVKDVQNKLSVKPS